MSDFLNAGAFYLLAAVTLAGFSAGAIRTIRPLARDGWKNSGRALR